MTKPVTVVDYDLGNLHSVIKALRHTGAEVTVSSEPKVVAASERLILPGVGAFGDGMASLRRHHLDEALARYFDAERPFLGICLGMQMLLAQSEEFGLHAGLGVVPGRVVEIAREPDLKVPQIGWNRVWPSPGQSWDGTLLEGVEPGSMFYFVHSFTAVPEDAGNRLADATYGQTLVSAAVRRGHIVGTQFHPEKSGELGLSLLRRFLAL